MSSSLPSFDDDVTTTTTTTARSTTVALRTTTTPRRTTRMSTTTKSSPKIPSWHHHHHYHHHHHGDYPHSSTATYEGDYETVDDHKKHEKIPGINSSLTPNICDASYDAIATLRSELFIFIDQVRKNLLL